MASRRPSQLWHAWALLFWDAVLFFAEDPGPMPGRTLEEAPELYTSLFGWKAKPSKDYTEFTAPGASYPMGGMMQIPEDWGPVPPYWLTYFAVSDAHATVARAQKLGGEVFVPPTDIPNTGRFAVLQDPQGAMFAVIKLTLPGS